LNQNPKFLDFLRSDGFVKRIVARDHFFAGKGRGRNRTTPKTVKRARMTFANALA
jgi:hypothetical protein